MKFHFGSFNLVKALVLRIYDGSIKTTDFPANFILQYKYINEKH